MNIIKVKTIKKRNGVKIFINLNGKTETYVHNTKTLQMKEGATHDNKNIEVIW